MLRISNVVNETDLVCKFKNERLSSMDIPKLSYFCSKYMEFDLLNNGEILFKEGTIT